MAIDLGDYAEDSIIDFTWDSNDSAGASVTRTVNGTVSVYKGNSITQSTAGVTDTEDFDGLTGVHHVRIDTSADVFYTTGNDYHVILSAATIDSQTVNATLARFSIQNRYAGGAASVTEAGIATAVWDRAKASHTAAGSFGAEVGLNTDIKAQTDKLTFDGANHVVADTRKISTSVTAADNVEALIANLDVAVSSRLAAADVPTNFADLAITVSTGQVTVGTNNDKTDYSLSTAGEQSAADTIIGRGVSNSEGTADTTSLAAVILAMLESERSGTTWTIRKTGGTTFVTKTLTVDAAADPVTGVT